MTTFFHNIPFELATLGTVLLALIALAVLVACLCPVVSFFYNRFFADAFDVCLYGDDDGKN